MTREEQIEQKAKELGQKYFPDEYNVWARPNYEAQYVESACKEMVEWADEHPQNPQLSAADRGIIDEIIFALNSLGKDKMISYYKEIEFLNKIRKL